METLSGRRVNLVAPDPQSINLIDIAVALSRIRRYSGHTREPYSVAAHSVWTARLCERADCDSATILHALLHDAHEAYIGDIPTPVKRLPDVFEAIYACSERLQNTIYEALRLAPPTVEQQDWVAWADSFALVEEAATFMPSRGADWGVKVLRAPRSFTGLPPLVIPDTAERSAETFLQIYRKHYIEVKR
ncbi:MAG: hypothetical protein B7Z66_07280 [Chromatiales bacterium 21-64-14]|nr:MAG: hypothetical protein B7Z66_07280 [Chromatiales bacterium 21-64-14]